MLIAIMLQGLLLPCRTTDAVPPRLTVDQQQRGGGSREEAASSGGGAQQGAGAAGCACSAAAGLLPAPATRAARYGRALAAAELTRLIATEFIAAAMDHAFMLHLRRLALA